MRKRINTAAICSSANYVQSKKAHREYLERTHEERVASISLMAKSTKEEAQTPKVPKVFTRAWIMFCGKKKYLEKYDIQRTIEAGFKVHYE